MLLPRIAVVIPTLTSPQTLEGVLRSLSMQTLKPTEVVVVAQRDESEAISIVEREYPRARVVVSDEGLSKARNAGVRALQTDWDVVALPDDDIVYPSETLMGAAQLFSEGYDGVCARVLPVNGSPRLNFSSSQTVVDRKNVWRTTLEPGYMLSKRTYTEMGGFDEGLGIGSESPWQSGEGTDLLLRAIEKGHKIVFAPDLTVTELDDLSAATLVGVTKARKYARGTGRVYRRRYGAKTQFALIAKSVARVLVRGVTLKGARVRTDTAILLGRFEGLMGRTIEFGPR